MRYLFCGPVTSDFLFPLAGLAQELQRRGHEVAFATGAMAEAVLTGAGLARIPCAEPGSDSFRLQPWPARPAVETDLRHLEHAARLFAPDALVGAEMSFVAPVAAERLGLPLVVMGQAEQVAPRRGAGPLLERVRDWFGLAPRPSGDPDFPLVAELLLLRSVPALHAAGLPAWVHPAGACAWQPEGAGAAVARAMEDAGNAREPLVCVDHRRIVQHETGFWPEMVDELGGERLRVAAAVAAWDHRPPLPLGWAVGDRVPLSLLARARLVVCGLRSAVPLAALEHGVPTLFIRGDVELEGSHVRALEGAGCAASLPLRPGELGPAVRAALDDPRLHAEARRVGAQFAALRGFGAAADAVERMPLRAAAAA